MNISQSGIALLYVAALLLGAALGLVYDGIRITRIFFGIHTDPRALNRLRGLRLFGREANPPRRRNPRLSGIVVFAGDFLFCILAGISLILLFYELNSGRIRVFAVFCSAAGFFFYRATLGRAVMLLSEVVAFFLMSTARWAAEQILRPIRALYRSVRRAIVALMKRWSAQYCRRERRRYTAGLFRAIPANAGGLLPGGAVLKPKEEEKTDEKSKKKAVQSERVGAGVSGAAHRRLARRFRNEHHAV